MLTGTTQRVRVLSDSCGGTHVITILTPDATPANRSSLFASEKLWTQQAESLPPDELDATRRAYFARDVAYIAAATIVANEPDETIVAAQDSTGALRGLSIYRFEDGIFHLLLHTTSPRDQGGNPSTCQTRGIGSELLGADADLMLSKLCTRVELEPLDAAAERYWRSRGFHNGTAPLHLSCPELVQLGLIYANSPRDDADQLVDCLPIRRRVSLRV